MRIGDLYPGMATSLDATQPVAQSSTAAKETNMAARGKSTGNVWYIRITVITLLGALIAAKFLEKRGA